LWRNDVEVSVKVDRGSSEAKGEFATKAGRGGCEK